MRPVVLVHGIWDTSRSLALMAQGLKAHGYQHVDALDFSPASGMAPLERLGEQLARFVARTMERSGCREVDLVGFSMGALVARLYLEQFGGAVHVRSFVSISGPHQGTLVAYGLPFPGVRQMRPGSALLTRLGPDVSHLHDVVVHCLYTPFDTMIIPPASSVLRGARSVHRVPVLLHRWMPADRRVISLVAELLGQNRAAEAAAQ